VQVARSAGAATVRITGRAGQGRGVQTAVITGSIMTLLLIGQ